MPRAWGVRVGVAGGLAIALTGLSTVTVPVPVAAKPRSHDTGPDRSCAVAEGSTSKLHLSATPWGLERIGPERAWPLSRGRGVKVAVIDSGVSTGPEVLRGAVVGGHDYLAAGDGTCDQYGHGTLVASIIAGREARSAPYFGVAPEAQILSYRVLLDSRPGSANTPHNIADAIDRAVDAGARVINLSLITDPTDEVRAAVRRAVDRDVVLVAAAGNEGGSAAEGSLEYPAALPGVLAVGGIDERGGHVGSSNTASYLEIAAPGDQMEGPAPAGGGYLRFKEGGTSFAAPYVSGTAALLRAYDPDLSAEQVRDRIIRTADHPPEGWNETVGYGVVNPYRALSAILKDDVPTHAPVGGQAMSDPHATVDPMRHTEIVASVLTAALLLLALLALIASRVVPRGRLRSWRAGRADRAGTPPSRPTVRRET
ncbi:MAG: type VII secretion-associated serine protease mycosin, partial [Actinocatenispora sp.]